MSSRDAQPAGGLGPLVLAAGGYFLLAQLGLTFATQENPISPFWPAAGFGLALAVLRGSGMALGVLAGGFLSAWIDQQSISYALVSGTAASIGAWVGWRVHAFVHQTAAFLGPFLRPAAVATAALLSAACSGMAGAGGLFLIGRLAPRELLPGSMDWWVGDAVGCLVLVPLVLALGAVRSFRGGTPAVQALRLVLALAMMAAVLLFIFYSSEGKYWIMFTFPVLLMVLVISGEGGLFAAVFFAALFCVAAANVGHRPFGNSYFNGVMLGIQVYVTAIAVVALVLSGLGRLGLSRLPATLLLLGWNMSGWYYADVNRKEYEMEESRLQGLALTVEDDLKRRLHTYVDILNGSTGLIVTNPNLTVADWQKYISVLDIPGRYPALLALSVVFPTRPEEEAGLVARLQAQSGRPFVIHEVAGAGPDSLRPDPAGRFRFIVGMIEPVDGNLPALGLDLASESMRRVAGMQSRDSGHTTMTKVIRLVQGDPDLAGFLLFQPVYQMGVMPSTVAERRALHLGWVTAPVRLDQFIQEVIKDHSNELAMCVFEGRTVPARENLLISTTPGEIPLQFNRVSTIDLLGESFTVAWRWRMSLLETKALGAAATAASFSLAWTFLAGLVVSLQSFAVRARREANERTKELRAVNMELALNNASLSSAENRLRANEAELTKLALVAERTSNAVVISDAAGRIEWINESFSRRTGYSLAEAKGRKPGELLQGPGTHPATIEAFKAKLNSRKGFRIEILYYHKDGSEIWLSIEVQPLFDAAGGLKGYIGIWNDTTQERLAKIELERARSEAEAANRAKSVFLGHVSHELRTPLNVIIGSTEMVLRGKHGPLYESQQRPLQRVRESASLLLGLINQLLDLTRAESGRLELEPAPVEIASLASEVVRLLEPEATKHGLTLKLELGHRTRVIEADPLRLKQILLNLIGNAVKFTPAGGHIDLLIGETDRPAEITFAVRDSGPGIPAADQERVFLEFERIDSRGLRISGTGLGLPIARRLAALHGGTLTLQSAPGQGCVFLVRLPRRIPESVAGAPVPTPSAPSVAVPAGGRLVLVAEDYPPNLELITSYLEAEGFRVAAATDGRQAVDQAIALQPAIVLMDVKMPVLDGLEAIRLLRKDERARTLPIIALTAFAYESDARTSLDAGANAYVSKPIDFDLLQRAMQRCLDSESGPPAA
jgi:PAS domain S-box-containing protein